MQRRGSSDERRDRGDLWCNRRRRPRRRPRLCRGRLPGRRDRARRTGPAGDCQAVASDGGTGIGDPARRRRRCRAGRRGDAHRGGTGADRDLGQCGDGHGVRPGQRIERRGNPPRHRGDLPGLRARHPRRPALHAPAQPRHHRPGRLGAGLPRHPAAIGLLRGQVRRARFHRRAALRAAP
ncbi:hypothetical protein BAY1663_04993 [Pseudomonas sp. BAY1663]|nr:hypothetical protein BAY1663_04993 [Pseudomonas sp. BAY1663]